MLEGETQQSLSMQLQLFHERALPGLSGNSLMGPDFYDHQQASLFDEDDCYRTNAFDGQKEFPHVLQNDKAGFDAVTGNPPLVAMSITHGGASEATSPPPASAPSPPSALERRLADRLKALQDTARAAGKPIPAQLPAEAPLFEVPTGLIRILDRDLKAAGIPKRDERGRTIDVHALRTSTGTHLSRAGVSPRTAQAVMRHSKIDLTMNVYTDPRLLDIAGAIEALPDLPLDEDEKRSREAAQ